MRKAHASSKVNLMVRSIGVLAGVLVFVALLIWAIHLCTHESVTVVATFGAEFLIAVVIYYEIEQNRASAFLAEAHGQIYKDRAEIYDAFVNLEATNLEERGRAFTALVKSKRELRDNCHAQLLQFARMHYMLRWSIFHHDLMVKWFPQVLIRLWVMLGDYASQLSPVGFWYQKPFMEAVVKSIDLLETKKIPGVAIYSNSDTNQTVHVSLNELAKIRNDLNSKIRALVV